MNSILLRNFKRHLLTAIMLVTLTACASGTADIYGGGDPTFVGSVDVKRDLSNRSTLIINYLATRGTNEQFVSPGVQFNGIRVNAPATLDNTYSYQAITSQYEYTLFPGRLLELTMAPSLQLGYFTLRGKTEGLRPEFNQLYPSYGLNLGTSLNFSDHTRARFEAALFDQKGQNVYATTGFWLEHNFRNDFGLRFGYSTHLIGDGDLNASDGCFSTDSLAEDCQDSDFEIDTNGVHFGLLYRP